MTTPARGRDVKDCLTPGPRGLASAPLDARAIARGVPLHAGPAPLSPAWTVGVRALCAAALAPYMHAAYRIRGWGRLPFRRGPTLVVSNHVHDLDTVAMVMRLSIDGPWRDPIFVAVSRRLFEPGYMAVRAPRLARWLSRSDWSPFFRSLGFLPIENELRARPLASLAWPVYQARASLRLGDVFDDAACRALGPAAAEAPLGDVWSARCGRLARTRVTLEALREPHRSEVRLLTRRQVAEDIARMQDVLRGGGTLHIMPEGGPSPDGRLHRLRAGLWTLLPLARVYLAPISYDPFLGRRLSILYRVIPLPESSDVAAELAAARPVTVSQLLAAWLSERGAGETFSEAEALEAVAAQMDALPAPAFVDPALRRRPGQVVRAALAALLRLRLLRRTRGRYGWGDRRTHPKFPAVRDIIAHQSRFFAETRDALARISPRETPGEHRRT